MNACNWEIIDGFDSPGEYKRFCVWLSVQVDLDAVEHIPITKPSIDLISGLEERWYRCIESGDMALGCS